MIEIQEPQIVDLTLTVGDPPVTMLPSRFTRMLYSFVPANLEGLSVLEVGTGGGGMLIAIKKYDGAGLCVGTDIDPAALAVARQNAAINGVKGIEWLPGPMFEPVRGRRFDLIVCNPASMPAALIADGHGQVYRSGGPDGRDMIRQIATHSASHLLPGGCVMFVCGGICDVEQTLSEMRGAGLEASVLYAEAFETDARFTPDIEARRRWKIQSSHGSQLIEASPGLWYELRYILLGHRPG